MFPNESEVDSLVSRILSEMLCLKFMTHNLQNPILLYLCAVCCRAPTILIKIQTEIALENPCFFCSTFFISNHRFSFFSSVMSVAKRWLFFLFLFSTPSQFLSPLSNPSSAHALLAQTTPLVAAGRGHRSLRNWTTSWGREPLGTGNSRLAAPGVCLLVETQLETNSIRFPGHSLS